MKRNIIAVDGEGTNTNQYIYFLGPLIVKQKGASESLAQKADSWAQKHIYTLLAASDGQYIENYKGLSTRDCLDFLMNYANDLVISYAFTYDANMIFRDLDEDTLMRLNAGLWIDYDDFEIKFIPRKTLTIKRDGVTVTIWDVFGYFQQSFVSALKAWDISETETTDAIQSMKMKRGTFAKNEKEAIREYCLSECKLLVELFDKLLTYAHKAGIIPTRYDGAGSLATAILRKYHVKDSFKDFPKIEPYALSAYFGGRFEMRVPGLYDTLYNYDIASAYPKALTNAPCLAHSKFRHRIPEFHEKGLVKVKWDIPEYYENLYMPFPFRLSDGSIIYPRKGIGWYWYHEYLAAIRIFPNNIDILDGYTLIQKCEHQPFEHLFELFALRKEMKRTGDLGHLVLKLGYNSEYGKTAQALSGLRKPPYQNWFIASFVTSHCRAQLLEAIALAPTSIVNIATDGIASTKKISGLDIGKELGQWEETTLKDVFLIRPNLYSYTEDDKSVVKCGGLNKDETPTDILKDSFITDGPNALVYVRLQRFMGLGTALKRGLLKNGWGYWFHEKRAIQTSEHNRIIIPADPPYQQLQTIAFQGELKESKPYTPKGTWAQSFENNSYTLISDQEQPD